MVGYINNRWMVGWLKIYMKAQMDGWIDKNRWMDGQKKYMKKQVCLDR